MGPGVRVWTPRSWLHAPRWSNLPIITTRWGACQTFCRVLCRDRVETCVDSLTAARASRGVHASTRAAAAVKSAPSLFPVQFNRRPPTAENRSAGYSSCVFSDSGAITCAIPFCNGRFVVLAQRSKVRPPFWPYSSRSLFRADTCSLTRRQPRRQPIRNAGWTTRSERSRLPTIRSKLC